MRILFLSNDIGRGGAERQIVELACEMQARGHVVAVGVLMKFFDFEAELHQAGVQTFALGLAKGQKGAVAFFHLVRRTLTFAPDVVHAHLFGASMAARALRPLVPRAKIICTSHCPFERVPSRYRILRWTDGMADLWTNVSSVGLAEHLRQGAVRSGIVRANGIRSERMIATKPRAEVRRALGASPGEFIWLSLGSMRDDQKDFPNLLRALRTLRTSLWIAGDGLLRADIESVARAEGVFERVRFLGIRQDVADLMAAADGYVQSSWYEALPISLLEAHAAGLPIVATRVGDNHTIVEHEVSGILVPKQDSPALAQAMLRVEAMDPAARAMWGSRGREFVREHFSLSAITDAWLATYRELLANSGNTRPVAHGQ